MGMPKHQPPNAHHPDKPALSLHNTTEEWRSHKTAKRVIYAVTVVGLAIAAAFVVYGFVSGIFMDREALETFIRNTGVIAPLVFIFIQIVQVVFPVIPGGASCLAGVVLFGPWWGFLYNYIGICVGSIINFFLGRFYGKPFIQSVSKPETYNKYIGKIDKGKRFDRFFFLSVFLPGFPDDLICMLAGLTKMTVKRYLLLLLTAKPLSIALYSVAWGLAAEKLLALLV